MMEQKKIYILLFTFQIEYNQIESKMVGMR
jgi:hypothetical protein